MKLEGHQKRLTIFVGIRAFLPVLDELITEGLVVVDDVEVVKYVGRGTE